VALDLDKYRLGGHVGAIEAINRLGLPGVPGKGLTYTHSALDDNPTYTQALNSILADPSALRVVRSLPTTKSNLWQDLATFAGGVVGLFTGQPLVAGAALGKTFLGEQKEEALRASIAGEVGRSVFPPLSEVAPVGMPYTEGGPMFEDLFENVAGFFDTGGWDVNWSDVVDVGSDFATNYMQGSYATPVANRGGGGVPAPVPGTGQGGILGRYLQRGVGRSFFNKWPNLATAIQKMRNAGQNVSRSKLYSMLKRFGPEFLVTGGILTAAAVQELALAGPGHRRMNPANSKALRRSIRRVVSFHKLCKVADVIATSHRRKRCK